MTGRFAPSPSGRMHLGNLFSALLAWLSCRAQGGELLLRIEDLDPRCHLEYAETIRDDLRWLGLDWDRESPPQSTRSAVYTAAFTRLEKMGLVYPCYCSRGALHAASAPHGAAPVYAGTCRGLTDAERAAKTKPPAWRCRVPDETVGFCDGLQGPYSELLSRDCGDFIVRRADGIYAYQLAVVCDDGEAGVTEVVRGRDLLSSTPRQLYLYRLFGLTPPSFCHVPLLLAQDGRRLSKRDGDLDMGALRRRYTPERLTGELACLAGLLERPEPVSARELAAAFSWSRVRREDQLVPLSIME